MKRTIRQKGTNLIEIEAGTKRLKNLESAAEQEDRLGVLDEESGVELVASAKLPTRFGVFSLYGFLEREGGKEHTALVHGRVVRTEACPVRVHSECHTGDVWGSLRCDCRQQLEASMRFIKTQEYGAVIYLRQEGRGIGLLNKLRAYRLQEQGMDTVDANRSLGLPTDARDYLAAAGILRLLKIKSIRLLTNNPEKINGLERKGITVNARIPLIISSNPYNQHYLQTKKKRLGHLLD